MDLILAITQNQRNLGISAHHQNKQMLNYILQKKDSISNSPKNIVMLEVSLNPTLWNNLGSFQKLCQTLTVSWYSFDLRPSSWMRIPLQSYAISIRSPFSCESCNLIEISACHLRRWLHWWQLQITPLQWNKTSFNINETSNNNCWCSLLILIYCNETIGQSHVAELTTRPYWT